MRSTISCERTADTETLRGIDSTCWRGYRAAFPIAAETQQKGAFHSLQQPYFTLDHFDPVPLLLADGEPSSPSRLLSILARAMDILLLPGQCSESMSSVFVFHLPRAMLAPPQ